MRFNVTRTSLGSQYVDEEDIKPPCEGAVRVGPVGDYMGAKWEIEIADLDALIAFVRANGECVVSAAVLGDSPLMAIEIYDDYRG